MNPSSRSSTPVAKSVLERYGFLSSPSTHATSQWALLTSSDASDPPTAHQRMSQSSEAEVLQIASKRQRQDESSEGEDSWQIRCPQRKRQCRLQRTPSDMRTSPLGFSKSLDDPSAVSQQRAPRHNRTENRTSSVSAVSMSERAAVRPNSRRSTSPRATRLGARKVEVGGALETLGTVYLPGADGQTLRRSVRLRRGRQVQKQHTV